MKNDHCETQTVPPGTFFLSLRAERFSDHSLFLEFSLIERRAMLITSKINEKVLASFCGVAIL